MNLKTLTIQVIEIAKYAGKIIHDNIKNINSHNIETKGLNDFVTDIDKLCEQEIVKRLEKLLPDSGFITEEGTSEKIGKEYNWIIDPLDGTTNFIHGFFPCAVSIGLKQNDEIVLGVVYEVGLDESFYAWKNGGAWLNEKQIRVSKKSELKTALLATGFPYHDFKPLDKYIDLLKYLTKNTQGIRRLGSAATDMAYVACGRFDGFYEYNLKSYDVAAGIILVNEAGGKICDFRGGNDYLFGKEIVASNAGIFSEFSSVVKKYMND
ncbi:MAG TPA: inositol monophosphatase family protein [Bacteroidales bacterium]|nr:inositol monophosphatase family protein [Bacteroidales bacterium]